MLRFPLREGVRIWQKENGGKDGGRECRESAKAAGGQAARTRHQ